MQGSQRPTVVLERGYSDPAIYNMLRIPQRLYPSRGLVRPLLLME